MRKSSCARRLLSLLLALAMMLSLCACAGDRGGKSEEVKATEAVKQVAAVSGEEADAFMHNDAVIVEHYEHNSGLNTKPVAEREATEFHLYIPSTETMTGFVNATKVTAYQEGVQCAIDTADNLFARMYGHSMDYVDGASELSWVETELNEKFTRDAQAPRFYKDKALPVEGALPVLFEGSRSPFADDSLTVIISNFIEPGFDISCIAAGIEDYFDANPKSGACIIGLTSAFKGEFHIPQYNRSEEKSTVFIHNFSSTVPYYMVVVGPLAEVTRYSEQMFKRLDNREVEYDYDYFSNNRYEELFADPLTFNVIPDIGERKATYPILDSYNTGILTERDTGNAYFATSGSATAKDASTAGSGISITKSTQIALISTNYNGSAQYDYEYALYMLDQASGQWKEAGKNAEAMVHFTMEPKSGELEGMTGTILTSGREEIYAGALLDFGPESSLSRDNVYRLEVKIHLNQENPDAKADHSMSKLARMSITSTDYFSITDELCKAYFGNFVWTGTEPDVREVAADLFRHTPNLDSMLISLSEVEGKYESYTEKYAFLDFIFNIKDKNSKR